MECLGLGSAERKSTSRFKKSLSLVLIRLVLIEILRFKNVKINEEMYGHPDAVLDRVRMAIHFFVKFDIFKWLLITVKTSLISTKLGDFVNLDVLFLTM